MTKLLTAEKTGTLVDLMIRRVSYCRADGCYARIDGDLLVFEQRKSDGQVVETHQIDWTCSTEERAWAHWEGFCANVGFGLAVGDVVRFEAASAWRTGGYRTATVTDIGPRRVTVEGHYKHGGAFKTRVSKKSILVRE